MKSPAPILKAKNISFSYGDTPVLKNINLELNRREILGIIGESGSGKTSLMKLLAGLLEPDKGELSFCGEKIKGPDETLVPGHAKIKLVNQDFDLMPYLSVQDNIKRRTLGLSESVQKRLLGHFRKRLKLKNIDQSRAADTSGGQKQRVALATALAAKPEVLILDEPFSNLDYPLKQEMIRLLKTEWKAEAMIVATHEPADMLAMAQRILVLHKGKIVQSGTAEEIYRHPRNEYVAQLLGPVNILSPEQAKVFGVETDQKLMLRPKDFKVSNNGLKANVLSCQYLILGYEVTFYCPAVDAKLMLYSPSPLAGDIEISVQ